MPGWGGWPEIDNKTISVQLNLTGTATGTELGKMARSDGCHICKGKKCKATNHCLCHTVAKFGKFQQLIRKWLNVLLESQNLDHSSGGELGPKPDTLFRALILHFVKDNCEHALENAARIVDTQNDIQPADFLTLHLLLKKKFHRCYGILKMRDLSAANMKMIHNNKIHEDIGWLCKISTSVSPLTNHLLNVVVPVIVIKLYILKKMENYKNSRFWTFLLGTHPRLGCSSPVRKITGLTPVIKKIHDYCLLLPDSYIDSHTKKIKRQLTLLFSICKIRKLMVDILKLPPEDLGSRWRCQDCEEGGDCHRRYGGTVGAQSWEKTIKMEHGLSYLLLQKALVDYSDLVAILVKEGAAKDMVDHIL